MSITYFFKLVVFLFLCMLAFGGDVAASNTRLTETNIELAVTSEDPEALFSLAVKYENAEGVPLDRERALALYCQAAKLGYADAQYALGWMYANGRGVARDDGIAAQLFMMAAEQGHAHAQQMIQYVSTTSESSLPTCLQSHIYKQIDKRIADSDNSIFKLVAELAPRYKVDPDLVMAVISVESGFDVQAISPKNAQGLMQLIPETAERFQVKNAFDVEDNIRGGMAYLRWLLAFFKGNVSLVAAAYNAGEGAVEKYQGIPPYPETENYVRKIKERYQKATHPYQPEIVNRHSFILTASESD